MDWGFGGIGWPGGMGRGEVPEEGAVGWGLGAYGWMIRFEWNRRKVVVLLLLLLAAGMGGRVSMKHTSAYTS